MGGGIPLCLPILTKLNVSDWWTACQAVEEVLHMDGGSIVVAEMVGCWCSGRIWTSCGAAGHCAGRGWGHGGNE